MIRHIVMLRWSEPVAESTLEAMAAAFDALPGQIPELLTYHHGRDLGLAPTNHDYAVTATFARAEDVAVYRDHPAHQQLVADFVAGRAERVAVQFEYDA